MSASVAAWRASAVRKGVMGLESDNDWFSPSWSVHVIEFLAYFACAARRPSHRLHLLLALSSVLKARRFYRSARRFLAVFLRSTFTVDSHWSTT